MSVGDYEWRFQASLPKTCLFCQYGYPVVFGTDDWLESFACGAHILDNPKGKKVTLKLNEKRATGSGILYAPLTIPEDCCNQFTPIKLGGRKFRLLDAFGCFEKGIG